jgi:hypothetical protein
MRISASFDPSAVRVDTAQSIQVVARPTSLLHHFGLMFEKLFVKTSALVFYRIAAYAWGDRDGDGV